MCLFFFSFFLSLFTFYLPCPVCSPDLIYPFCFLQKIYEVTKKRKKKSDIYKGIHHYLDIIFRGIGKALGTESDSSWDALNWNLLSQAWKGVAIPSKLFQDQTQNTAHFVQLIPFTVIIFPPQEFLKYFTFYLYGNGDFHMKKRLFRIQAYSSSWTITRDQTPDVHFFRFVERTFKPGRCFADDLSQHRCS